MIRGIERRKTFRDNKDRDEEIVKKKNFKLLEQIS